MTVASDSRASRGDELGLDLAPHLRTRQIGRVVEVHRRIGSTNDRARALARSGAVHGLVVLAHAQTAGRGQHGRRWESPPGLGIYASFLLRPRLLPRQAPMLTAIAGLALRDGVAMGCGVEALIKWPNDLLAPNGPLFGRKIAGVLVEASADPNRIDHAVVGIGLNVREGQGPAELAAYATSLEALSGRRDAIDCGKLLASIANELEARLHEVEIEGIAGIQRAWAVHAAGRGSEVSLELDGAVIRGELAGIAQDGALLLRTPDGLLPHHRGELWIPGAPHRP